MTAGFLLFDKVVADLDVQRVHSEQLIAAGLNPSAMSEAAITSAAQVWERRPVFTRQPPR